METTPCDLCGSTHTRTIIPAAAWRASVPGGAAMVACTNCGLVYLNPRPSAREIGQYYPEDYMSFHRAVEDEAFPLMRWMRQRKFAHRRKLLEQVCGKIRGSVLDVGCGTGLFLNEMQQNGWQAQGVEPTRSAAEYARERFGLAVAAGFIEDLPAPAGSFDVITFWDVLEHTYSPSTSLAAAHRLLADNGWVAINVPNWRSPDRPLFGPHWIGYDPPRHLYVFTRQTLTRLLENAGFLPVEWKCIMPGYFASILSLDSALRARSPRLAKFVWGLLNIPGMRFVFEPYFWLLNLLKAGPTITVFARKGTP